MTTTTGQHKYIGTAGSVVDYYRQESDDPALERMVDYYGTPKGDVVFSHVRGKAAAHLAGLDIGLGLTRKQHADIHNGRWGRKHLTRGNYAFQVETDTNGNPVMVLDPKTGRLTPKVKTEDLLDEDGNPVIDPDSGEVKQRKLTQDRTVAGYDVRFSLDKSWSEFLIAHPEHADLVKAKMREAVDVAMTVAVEDHCELIVSKKGGVKTTSKAEGLLWVSVLGATARPTDASIKRGYVADPHLHAHTFLFASAYVGDDKWQKIDGKALLRGAEMRGHVFSAEFNRLMEAEGLRVSYLEPDRKGRIQSHVGGSNPKVGQYFSTNADRLEDLRRTFEAKYKRPPSHQELEAIKGATKAKKSKAAKAADEVGNVDQLALWREALKQAGIDETVEDLQPIPVMHRTERARRKEFFARMERPDGVARDIKTNPEFGPEVIMPAAFRCAEGLGATTTEIQDWATLYRDTELIVTRPAKDPSAVLYTTKSIVAAETAVEDGLERLAAKPVKAANAVDRIAVLRAADFRLDQYQRELVNRATGAERLVHGEGRAGSGKSAAARPIADILRRSGLVTEVIVIAQQRKRAEDMGEEVNADKSWSVEALKYNADKGWKSKDDKTLVIVDEVALLNTFEMNDVLDCIGDARVLTVGDQKQATALGIGAGWLVDELEKRPAVELKSNYRQKDLADIRAWELIRDGKGREAVDDLHKRGRIFLADDPQHLITEAQKRFEFYRYTKHRHLDEIAFINTGTNETLDGLNRMVQRVRAEHGEIEESRYFDVIEQSSGRRWRLHEGDRIIFNQGVYFNRQNGNHIAPVRNGATGTIRRVLRDGTCLIELDKGRQVTVKLERELQVQNVGLAYAMSTFKYQGGQVPIVLHVPGSPEIASLNSAYSTNSRNMEVTEVILDRETWGPEYPLQNLGDAWSTATVKERATTLIERREALRQQAEQQLSQSESMGMGLGMHL